MLTSKTKHSGFTIVELLIVIIVIAILATLVITAYNGVQDKARASVISDGLRKIDKAFNLYAADQGVSTWWLDNELTGSSNPSLSSVISSTGLKDYLQQVPQPSGMSLTWKYDNDGDGNNGCTNSSGGVNIYIYPVNSGVAQSIDNMIDDGNLSCGKVYYQANNNNGELFYNLSKGQNLN